MPKTRTMYMHTLDGKPAGYQDVLGSPQVYFAGFRDKVTLAPTLRELRRQQAAARREYELISGREQDRRYGYVLVEVPA